MSYDDSSRSGSPGGIGRVPPHNADAEASLIGAMLLSRDAIGPAVELLDGRGGRQLLAEADRSSP